MLSCNLQGSLIWSLGVTLSRNWEACQNNFHYGILFIFGGVLGVVGGTVASRVTSLVISAPFFVCLRLLDRFWRIARRGWDLAGVVLFRICHFGRGVCLGVARGGSTDRWGVVEIFCLPKHKRSLKSSSVEGFIPYLGIVNPTHPWDLSS